MTPRTTTAFDLLADRRVMNYVECDLSVELTLPERRRARCAAAPAHRLHALRRRLAPAPRPRR